jgi:hypothetical protein
LFLWCYWYCLCVHFIFLFSCFALIEHHKGIAKNKYVSIGKVKYFLKKGYHLPVPAGILPAPRQNKIVIRSGLHQFFTPLRSLSTGMSSEMDVYREVKSSSGMMLNNRRLQSRLAETKKIPYRLEVGRVTVTRNHMPEGTAPCI